MAKKSASARLRKPSDKPPKVEKSARRAWLVSKGLPLADAKQATREDDDSATAADEVEAAVAKCRSFRKKR